MKLFVFFFFFFFAFSMTSSRARMRTHVLQQRPSPKTVATNSTTKAANGETCSSWVVEGVHGPHPGHQEADWPSLCFAPFHVRSTGRAGQLVPSNTSMLLASAKGREKDVFVDRDRGTQVNQHDASHAVSTIQPCFLCRLLGVVIVVSVATRFRELCLATGPPWIVRSTFVCRAQVVVQIAMSGGAARGTRGLGQKRTASASLQTYWLPAISALGKVAVPTTTCTT